MSPLFADTSGWGYLADSSQSLHTLAKAIYFTALRQRRKIVTTNYIVTELVALMNSPLRIPRPIIVNFIESLKTSPYVEIIHIDHSLDGQAWQLLKNREDKDWSLVDCASFVLMKQYGITEAMTTDHHFEQAGFVRLLQP